MMGLGEMGEMRERSEMKWRLLFFLFFNSTSGSLGLCCWAQCYLRYWYFTKVMSR